MSSAMFDYIETVVREIDPNLILLDDPFGDDNYAREGEVETGYKIVFGASTTTKESSYFTRVFPCTIEISQKAFRDVIPEYKEVFDKALAIESELISPARVSITTFSDIISTGITPEPFSDNDRTIKMLINIQFVRSFSCD